MKTVILNVEDGSVITITHPQTSIVTLSSPAASISGELVNGPDDLRGAATRRHAIDTMKKVWCNYDRNEFFRRLRMKYGWPPTARTMESQFWAWRNKDRTPQRKNAICLFQLYQEAVAELSKQSSR